MAGSNSLQLEPNRQLMANADGWGPNLDVSRLGFSDACFVFPPNFQDILENVRFV